MPGVEPGNLAQALMELGATVCTPRNTDCEICPVRAECRARRAGRVDEIPPPRKRRKPRVVPLTALVIHAQGGQVWLERRPESGLFAGLWCPPLIDDHQTIDALKTHGLHPLFERMEAAGECSHRLTHRELVVRVFRARTLPGHPVPGLSALAVDALCDYAIPTFTAKLLRVGLPAPLRARARLPGRAPLKTA